MQRFRSEAIRMPGGDHQQDFETILEGHTGIGRAQIGPSEIEQTIDRSAWTSGPIRQLNFDRLRRRKSERLQVSDYEKFSPSATHYQFRICRLRNARLTVNRPVILWVLGCGHGALGPLTFFDLYVFGGT